jgi:hypothetical protein
MASASTRKICTSANGCKQVAIITCEGCSQAFCTQHFGGHRNLLNDEMNEIIGEHDDLTNSFIQQTNSQDSHPYVLQIHNWEQQSISRIQQRAQELRLHLSALTNNHKNDCSEQLQNLSKQIIECREHGDFMEADLHHWREILKDLKLNIASPPTITIDRDNNTPLALNISINQTTKPINDIFERVFNNTVRIIENGQTAIHEGPYGFVEVRGKNQYVSGSHKIRLFLENFEDAWMFVGINSVSTPLQNYSYRTKSAYGWGIKTYNWLNGIPNLNVENHSIDLESNDVIGLIFDCDTSQISLINERTKAKHELTVNVQKCPIPWQLHVILRTENTRIRILPVEFHRDGYSS